MAEFEEDLKPDHTADAIDELDQLANDLESSSNNSSDGSEEESKKWGQPISTQPLKGSRTESRETWFSLSRFEYDLQK